jgi:uncharacterized protein (TIGR00297 family)/Raf kinase inhibitor-like YbhB/YbcL family protein
MTILLGMILAAGIAWLAWWKKSLDRSGAIAAAIMGTIIFGLGGLTWAVLLLTFFISSSLLSYVKKQAKLQFEEKFSKTSQRDAYQVFANGGLAMLLALLNHLMPQNNWIWLAFAAALAAANADTWATEIGVLAKVAPRLITNRAEVEPGTSGAVTKMGILASAGGAALIAFPAVLLWQGSLPPAGFLGNFFIFLFITAAGTAGSIFDSYLGATVQAIFYCPNCQKETERSPLHTCQTQTQHIRGWRWLDNDLVNFAATLSGSLAALLLAVLFSITPIFSISGRMSSQQINFFSPAFKYGGEIPQEYTCTGDNRPVDLSWNNLPAETQALFIVMQDTDTPTGRITHWIATTQLPRDTPSISTMLTWTNGHNYNNSGSYTGPCPPPDPAHRYYFRLYALDQPLALTEGFTWQQAVWKMRNHVLAEGQVMGKY